MSFYAVILELSVRVAPSYHGTVAGRHRDTFTPAGTRCCASPAPANFGTKVTRPSVTGHWPHHAACSAGEKISCEDKEPYKVYSGVIFAHHRSRIPIRCGGCGGQVAGAGRSQSPHQHYHPSIPHIPPQPQARGSYNPDNTADILTYLHNT